MHCVRDCQHPWFGGNGACVLGADNTPACVCGPAFSVVDILGQPACESKAVRTVCHFVGCLLSAICFAVAARRLRASPSGDMFNSSPRGGEMSVFGFYTRPRIVRLVLAGATLWSVSVFAFHVASWKMRWTLQTLFPLMTCSVAWGACAGLCTLRLWLFVLPSRLMKKTSLPSVVRYWSDDRHGLVIASSCYWAWLVCCGIVGRFNSLRGRALMLGSTVLMVSFYAVVVLSVSLTLSKAIRDSEKSMANAMSSPSSNNVQPLFKRWATLRVRSGFGASGCDHEEGVGVDVGETPTAHRPKGGGDYTQTKRLLRKLTVGTVVLLATVMATVVASLRKGTIAHDTPLVFFMALFTTMPSIWLIITMQYLTRKSVVASSAKATMAGSPVRSTASPNTTPKLYTHNCSSANDLEESRASTRNLFFPGRMLHRTLRTASFARRLGRKYSEERKKRVRVAPVLHTAVE